MPLNDWKMKREKRARGSRSVTGRFPNVNEASDSVNKYITSQINK